MTCGCGQTKGTIACRNGAKRDGQTVTRAVICAACPNMRQTGEHADAGVCSRSGYTVDEHTVYGLPCPEGRHPDAKGIVHTPITIGRLNIRVKTHGAPMWQRLELWSKGSISTVRAPKVPGCGCIVQAKRAVRVAWWAATNLDRWLRVCRRKLHRHRHLRATAM
ncbi:MAG: hypothetical protein ACK55O_15830 [Phycisphaerales bacterium]|jgi:hypothetical protein